MKTTFRFIDLFAGAGGFSQGLMMVKGINGTRAFEMIKAVEIDDAACESLQTHLHSENLPADKIVLEGDLSNSTVKTNVINESKEVDLIIGCPPCQTYSLAGPARSGRRDLREKLRHDVRNTLFRHFLDIVREVRPAFVVFENVEGIISSQIQEEVTGNAGKVLNMIIDGLRQIGYSTTLIHKGKDREYLILNAADYGVPQTRRRVFIIANRLGLLNPVPSSVCNPDEGRPYRNLASAISDLPPVLPPVNMVNFEKLKKLKLIAEYPEEYLRPFVESIKRLAEKACGTPAEDVMLEIAHVTQEEYKRVIECRSGRIKALRMFAEKYNQSLGKLNGEIYARSPFPAPHVSRPHNIRDLCIFSRMVPGTNSAEFMNQRSPYYDPYLDRIYPYSRRNHMDTYVKHRWDLPSSTILSHMNRDGLKFIHPEQPRTFTPCEAALLQSFNSKGTRFCGSRSQIFWQIGNAVPPLMAKAIGEAVYRTLLHYYSNINETEKET